jgi:toxin ParE1/3/4
MMIVYSRRALSQLASIFDYLIERNPRAARDVRESIAITIARLQHLPRLGKLTDELGVHIIIEPEYLYRVFYLIDGNRVIVLRVLHPSQR